MSAAYRWDRDRFRSWPSQSEETVQWERWNIDWKRVETGLCRNPKLGNPHVVVWPIRRRGEHPSSGHREYCAWAVNIRCWALSRSLGQRSTGFTDSQFCKLEV